MNKMHPEVSFSLILGILYFLLPQNECQITPELPYYVGAVVEYHPIDIKDDFEAATVTNADNYVAIIKKAKELNSNLDIIVFPESSLTNTPAAREKYKSVEELRKNYVSAASHVPSPVEKVTPCDDDNTKVSNALKTLSCAAKQYKTYVVVNHLEIENCTNCNINNNSLYNSNIVFDRYGTVVGRYRKYNLFIEPLLNITSEPELSIFETDFGVKFGQFICFDILFDTPALQLLEKFKITDIIFSHHWFAELPFLSALQVQAGWSYANDVNLLSSGYNYPSTGSTGTSIIAGTYEKILGRFHSRTNKNAVLIANVPKVKNGVRNKVKNDTVLYEFSNEEISPIKDESETLNYIFFDNMEYYSTKIVRPEMDQFLTICSDDFCCYFQHKAEYNMTVIISGEKYYRYRFGAFAGNRLFGIGTRGVQVCGLMTCTNDSLASCGRTFHGNDTFKDWVTFQKLGISVILPRRENVRLLNLPISLQTNFIPLNPSDFIFKSVAMNNVDYDFLSLSLEQPQQSLMSFGIYGRNFSADGGELTSASSASSMRYSIGIISLVMIFTLLNFEKN